MRKIKCLGYYFTNRNRKEKISTMEYSRNITFKKSFSFDISFQYLIVILFKKSWKQAKLEKREKLVYNIKILVDVGVGTNVFVYWITTLKCLKSLILTIYTLYYLIKKKFLVLTFLQAIDLFVGERRSIPLQLSFQPKPQLGVLISWRVVFWISIGRVFVHSICWNKKTWRS